MKYGVTLIMWKCFSELFKHTSLIGVISNGFKKCIPTRIHVHESYSDFSEINQSVSQFLESIRPGSSQTLEPALWHLGGVCCSKKTKNHHNSSQRMFAARTLSSKMPQLDWFKVKNGPNSNTSNFKGSQTGDTKSTETEVQSKGEMVCFAPHPKLKRRADKLVIRFMQCDWEFGRTPDSKKRFNIRYDNWNMWLSNRSGEPCSFSWF